MADVTIPSLLEMSVKCIAENLHLFSCLQGLPSFIVEMILSLFQQVLGSHNSLVDDDNIRQFLELRMQEQVILSLCLVSFFLFHAHIIYGYGFDD